MSPFDTFGFYRLLPDAKRQRPEDLIDSITLATTPEQDRAILDLINRTRADPRTYVLGGRNCGNFVQDALRKGGIETGGDVAIPRSVFDALRTSDLVIDMPPF